MGSLTRAIDVLNRAFCKSNCARIFRLQIRNHFITEKLKLCVCVCVCVFICTDGLDNSSRTPTDFKGNVEYW